MRFFHKCCSSRDGQPEDKAGRILRFGGHALFGAVAVVVVATVVGVIVMVAWNAVMPAIFHLPELMFWQAVALLVLARLLVGRLHGHGRRGRHKGAACYHGCGEETDGTPPNGDCFAQWWWEEGKAAFKAYQARRNVPTPPPSSAEG